MKGAFKSLNEGLSVKTGVGCPQNTDMRCPFFIDEIVQSVGSDRHLRAAFSGFGG